MGSVKIDRPGKIGPQRRGYRDPTTINGPRFTYESEEGLMAHWATEINALGSEFT